MLPDPDLVMWDVRGSRAAEVLRECGEIAEDGSYSGYPRPPIPIIVCLQSHLLLAIPDNLWRIALSTCLAHGKRGTGWWMPIHHTDIGHATLPAFDPTSIIAPSRTCSRKQPAGRLCFCLTPVDSARSAPTRSSAPFSSALSSASWQTRTLWRTRAERSCLQGCPCLRSSRF